MLPNNSLTAKQWFTVLMLGLFDQPPMLKQLADCCDSSHQNTKQIVLKLKEMDRMFADISKEEMEQMQHINKSMRILKM